MNVTVIDGQVGNCTSNIQVFVNLWRHSCLVVDWVDLAIDWRPIQGRVAILLVSSCTFLFHFYSGGAYIPPAGLKMMQECIEDKSR